MEIVRILKNIGFEVNVLFGPQSGGAKEWKEIPKAQFNLVISPWVGVNIAKHLEKKYNQPYLHIPVIPVGEEATTAFIRQLVEYTGIDAGKAEAFIAEADFGSGVPLILGSTWESDVARQKNALLIEINSPSSETVVLNRCHIEVLCSG